MTFYLEMSNIIRIFAVYKLSVSPYKSSSYMTKNEFKKLFGLFSYVVADGFDDVLSYSPSAHLIPHCGGYELELHPRLIMWGNEVSCLAMIVERMCCSMECRFSEGIIIIR